MKVTADLYLAEGIKAARLSGRRETHDQGIARLLCNSGIGASYRPEHGQKLNAAYKSKHHEPLHQNGDGAHERCGAKSRQTFGGNSGGKSLRKNTHTDIMPELLVGAVKARSRKERSGGGGQIRTVDAADMSRVDSDSNLLDLLAEILLEADAGGSSPD